jgi:hypothetical protein
MPEEITRGKLEAFPDYQWYFTQRHNLKQLTTFIGYTN